MNYNEQLDYSSLSTYLDCPRKFLFQYVMHLSSPRPSIHLVFGASYHYGLEVVYRHLMQEPNSLTVYDATALGFKAFMDYWKIEGEPNFPDEDIIFPKSPGHAENMYHDYWKRYLKLDQENKVVLAVESPFIIDLSKITGLALPSYIGRLDLVFKQSGDKIEIVDHKTAKSLWTNTLTGFEMSYQTDGYLTAGYLFYDKIPTMTYSISLCQKSKIAFQRFFVHKRKMVLEQFLNDITWYAKEIINNLNLLTEDLRVCESRNDHITSFRRSLGYACTTYMSACPYLDLCKMRNNPLGWMNNPPQGYVIKEWKPDEHEQSIKEKLKEVA